MKKVLIVAALERELTPLVRGWKHRTVVSQNRTVSIWESDLAIAACAGIGGISARIATDAAYKAANENVALIISAGLAGGLTPDLGVAAIVQPATIQDGVDGLTLQTAKGQGTLITSGALANTSDKATLSHSGALAVDMEAFAVADVARIYSVPFVAIKSISDPLDFKLPPLGRFISSEGQFHTGRFVVWAALRPWCWLTVIQLGRNTAAAIQTLTQALENTLQNHTRHP